MPALHPLQDHVVAGLQRQMQMRHQPLVVGDGVEQIAIGLDRIDRGNPQPLQLRHMPQDLLCQLPELRRARQIGAVAREVDAGQHDLGMAALDQRADLLDHRAHRHRARIAAAVGNDAEGAAVVAAVLHLHEDARQAALKPSSRCGAISVHRHDVGDRDLLARSMPKPNRTPRARRARRRCASCRHCRRRDRPRPCRRTCPACVCAAQPVTTMRASGRSRFSRRIDCRACATASLVTAQLLMTTVSDKPGALRLAARSPRIRRR